jgi:hypothetical protein
MYKRRSYYTEEFAIPIAEGRNALDVLMAPVLAVKELCDRHSLNPEDLETAHWSVESWPESSDPEHLVVRIQWEKPIFRDG